jgi:hypothetical protein
MDEKFYVSLEMARLLKEKGYDEKCISYYQDNCREIYYSFCGERNSNWEERCVSAPSKAEAMDWLEGKGFKFSIMFADNNMYEYIVYFENEYISVHDHISGYRETMLEAQDAAIITALEKL